MILAIWPAGSFRIRAKWSCSQLRPEKSLQLGATYLREEGVRRVSRVRVVPDLELVVLVGVKKRLGRIAERGGGSAEERLDVRLKRSHNEDRDRVGDLLNERTKKRDLVERVLNLLHDRVTEAENLPQRLVQLLRAHRGGVLRRAVGAHRLNVVHLTRQALALSIRKVQEQRTKGVSRVRLGVADAA